MCHSYFFFNGCEAQVAYPHAKVAGDFGGKPDCSVFGMVSVTYRLRRGFWDIGLETGVVLQKSGHVDWKDFLPSV